MVFYGTLANNVSTYISPEDNKSVTVDRKFKKILKRNTEKLNVISSKFSSLTAPDVMNMNFNVASNEIFFIKMTAFPLQ